MDNIQAYNHWADNYDTAINKTRDLEAIALWQMLLNIPFESQHLVNLSFLVTFISSLNNNNNKILFRQG